MVAHCEPDSLRPWSVETAVEGLRTSDLVYGDIAVVYSQTPTSRLNVMFYPPFDVGYYLYSSTIGQPSVFWRRDVVDEIGLLDISSSHELLGGRDARKETYPLGERPRN